MIFLIISSQNLYAEGSLKLTYTILPAQHPNLCEVHLKVSQVGDSCIDLQVPMSPENVPFIYEICDTSSNVLIFPNGEEQISPTLQDNQTIDITYRIRGVSKGSNNWFQLPQGDESYFHIYGDHLFVHPKTSKEVEIDLEWVGWPEEWVFANSLGIQQRRQCFRGSLDTFLATIFIGGDFQISSTKGPTPIALATRGSLLANAHDLLEKIEKIISTQRSFWKDDDFPTFLVTILPLGEEEVCCGRGLFQSFSICANDFSIAHTEELFHMISHEHFHTWNGIKMHSKPYPNTIWFFEGFTEYYAIKLSLLSGILDEPHYIDRINALIYKYQISPVRNYTNQRVINEYLSNDKAWDIDYYRGALIAAMWDQEIQRMTNNCKSLDDFMRALFLESQRNNGEITHEMVIQTASHFLNDQSILHIENYVVKGLQIPFIENLEFSGYSLKWIESSKLGDKFYSPSDDLKLKVLQFVK